MRRSMLTAERPVSSTLPPRTLPLSVCPRHELKLHGLSFKMYISSSVYFGEMKFGASTGETHLVSRMSLAQHLTLLWGEHEATAA